MVGCLRAEEARGKIEGVGQVDLVGAWALDEYGAG